jgi:hypothetical protein
MKNLLFTLAALAVAFQAEARTPAAAKSAGSTASYSSSSTSSSDRKNILSPSLGWMGAGYSTISDTTNGTNRMQLSGLFNVGVEYEYMLKDDFSVGGFMRYGMTSDSVSNTSIDESTFLMGPMVHAYLLNNASWLAYVGTGFTAVSIKHKESSGGQSTTWSPNVALGVPLSVGVAYKFTDMISGGIETMHVMALGSDINGWPVQDYMLRLRLAL